MALTPEQLKVITDLLMQPKDAVMKELDALAIKFPQLAANISDFRAFLLGLYTVLPTRVEEAVVEVTALLKTGKGPVVPDIGDTA